MTINKLTDEQIALWRAEALRVMKSADVYSEGYAAACAIAELSGELQQRRAADKNYFMYGIADPDGNPHFDECCVSADPEVIEEEVNALRDGYRVVALYTALPLTDAERAELQEYRKAADICAALAAENAGLKTGVTYFAYSPDYGFDYFKDKQSAIDTAQTEIDAYRDDADVEDGWSDDVQRVSWGVVVQQAQGFDAQGLHTSDSRHTYQTCEYRLIDIVKTPTTDAFLAEVRASAIEHAASERWGSGYVFDELNQFAAQIRKGEQP